MKKHGSKYTVARQTTKHTFLQTIEKGAFYIVTLDQLFESY